MTKKDDSTIRNWWTSKIAQTDRQILRRMFVPQIVPLGERIECDECAGSGECQNCDGQGQRDHECDCEYCDISTEQCDYCDDGECTICDGDGYFE